VGYGYLQSRRGDQIRSFAKNRKGPKALLAAGLLLLAVAILFGGLNLIYANGGFTEGGLRWWAWLGVCLIGLAFVHLQTLSLALIATIAQDAVTAGRPSASTSHNPRED
jgi:hypothetical protein